MSYEDLIKYIEDNKSQNIALFCDMDGVIADLDIDTKKSIYHNTPGYFLAKRPLLTIIDKLKVVSEYPNIDMYILSACKYRTQADEKVLWLEKHADFFPKENQLYVVQQETNYTGENKADIKTNFIVNIMKDKNYDKIIYIEDEYKMLKKAYKVFKDKIICIHISNFIE